MTKRDILDVRKKHAGGRPKDSHTKKNKRILALIERELERRGKWGQRLDDNREIANHVAEIFGRELRPERGTEAGWRVDPIHADMLADEIASRLKVTPSDLAKYPARVAEELDKLLNEPESRGFYFEYDPDLEWDTGNRVHSLGAVVGHVKRFKQNHPEFKTRKRGASKAKPPKS
jgi:hypothetical protein